MTRALHIGLLLMALLGLLGQSTAMAMVPAPVTIGSLQVSMSGMDCMDRAKAPVPGKAPCKTMTISRSGVMPGRHCAALPLGPHPD